MTRTTTLGTISRPRMPSPRHSIRTGNQTVLLTTVNEMSGTTSTSRLPFSVRRQLATASGIAYQIHIGTTTVSAPPSALLSVPLMTLILCLKALRRTRLCTTTGLLPDKVQTNVSSVVRMRLQGNLAFLRETILKTPHSQSLLLPLLRTRIGLEVRTTSLPYRTPKLLSAAKTADRQIVGKLRRTPRMLTSRHSYTTIPVRLADETKKGPKGTTLVLMSAIIPLVAHPCILVDPRAVKTTHSKTTYLPVTLLQ